MVNESPRSSVYPVMTHDPRYEEAFTDLLPSCTRLARRLLGDADAAQEVAGEALARLYEHWDLIGDSPAHYAGWTMRVTRNLAIDRLRRHDRDVALPDPDDAGAATPTALRAVDSASELVLRQALTDALATLPARQRHALALRYLLDLPQADVAAALGVTTGTVATHVHRALASLRTALCDQPCPPVPTRTEPTMTTPTNPHRPDDPHTSPADTSVRLASVDQARTLIGTHRRVAARIVEPIPGGYLADIGIPAVFRGRGNWKHERRHVDLTGAELDAEVVDIDADGRPVVTQPVTGADADEFARAQQTVRDMSPGQRRHGTVRAHLAFGAFVTVDGVDGLVHASELRPDEHLVAGQPIDVEVIATDIPLARASFRPAH